MARLAAEDQHGDADPVIESRRAMSLRFEHSVDVRCSADHAFSLLDDFAATPRWLDRCTHIDTLTPGPHAVGTKLRYGYRESGRTGTMDGEVIARSPNDRLAMRYRDAMLEIAVEFRIAPAESDSESRVRIAQIVEITPKSWVVKLATPLIRRQLPGQTAVAMQRLKALLEA